MVRVSGQGKSVTGVRERVVQGAKESKSVKREGGGKEEGGGGEGGGGGGGAGHGCPLWFSLVTTSLCQDWVICAPAAFL